MNSFSSANWTDHALLDSGDGQKLERFGHLHLLRPETSALWRPEWPVGQWAEKADARFVYGGQGKGKWQTNGTSPSEWTVSYPLGEGKITFELQLTRFKHIGLFPEQASNWEYIHANTGPGQKVLNLFAYTGGSSLAARAAGADVTHVDSIKQVVAWGKRNMELSGLSDIRWLVEDAQKFVQREARRGNVYDMIIMDPPSFGIGAKGEKWKLEDKLNELLADVAAISKSSTHWVISTYSGLSPIMLRNIVAHHRPGAEIDSRELVLPSQSKCDLPLGTVARVKG